MGSVMRPAHHRLPVHLPMHKSVEEVILARKMIPSSKYDGIYHHSSSAREAGPQRGKLASPSSPASYLSQLPPESYTRDVSKRLGKRPRSRAVRRADDPGRLGRSCGSFTPPPQQRPLTGVSPPSTAQTSFGFADYRAEGLRPTTSSGTPLSGRRTAEWGQDDNSNNHDNDHVAFLRDKCNALAARLQQLEIQLLIERAQGKHLHHSPSAPSDVPGKNSTAADDRTQLKRASTADARLTPRIADASSHGGSSQGTQSFTPEIQEGVYHCISGRRDEKTDGYDDEGAREGGDDFSAITNGPVGPPEALYTRGDGTFPLLSERGKACSRTGKHSGLMPARGGISGRVAPPSAGGFANTRAGGNVTQPGKIGRRLDAETRHCEMVEKEIADRFAVVADGMEKLENVFSGAAQMVEHRANAITTITSAIRMFLQRCRYLRAKEALKAWRIAQSIPVPESPRGAILRQKTIETGLLRMESRRERSIKTNYFKSWSSVVGTDEQRKIDIKLFGERVKNNQEYRLVRDVFRALRDQTVGPASSRELARRGHARMAEARERVLARAVTRGEEGLVVTLTMVRQEMSRGVVAVMEGKIKVNLCRSMLASLKKAVLFRKASEVQATENFRRWATRRVMKGWGKWAALKARGIDRHLMTGYKGRVGSRYNPNKVATFTRRREMTTVFTAWARKSKQLGIANRMQRKKLTLVVVGAFEKWKLETQKTKQVKKIAVGMWADFSLKELGEPFRMWYIFSESSKRQTIEQERLLKLYRRAKNRKKCYTILKAWRHLAVYGRVEGMYTRSQLMSSLAEQKEHTLRLVGRVDELAGGLGDMEELAMDYRSQMIIRQKETQEQAAGMERQTMALHHAEQEIVRLQSLLGTVAKIAPSVCKVVHKAAPDFDFQERGFTPLTEARAEAMKRAEDARVEGLVADRIAEKVNAEHKLGGSNSDEVGNHEGGQLNVPSSAQGHPTQQLLSPRNGTKPVAALQAPIETADAETQAWIGMDPEAAARAAVASAALALGTEPPVLPRELARLDRVEWVLRRTTLTEVSLGLRMEDDESDGGGWAVGSGGDHNNSDCDGAVGAEERSATRGIGVGGKARVAGDIVKLDGQQQKQQQMQQTTKNAEAPVSQREQEGGESIQPTTPADNSTAESNRDSPLAAAVTAASAGPTAAAVSSPDEKKSGGGRRAKDEEESEGDDDDVLERLSALFEFLRSGNSCVLPPDIRVAWESRPDLGLGLLAADDHVYGPRPHAGTPLSSAAGGGANSNDGKNVTANGGARYIASGGGGGGRRGVSSWRGLCGERRAGKGEPITFHDLRMALTATAPPGRRTESTNDRLERRLVEGRRRADGMAAALWGNERRQQSTENLYAPSQFSSSSRQQPSPTRMNE